MVDILFSVFVAVIVGLGYAVYTTFRLPSNAPRRVARKKKSSSLVIACLGDSLTHGNLSYNYTKTIGEKLGDYHPAIINGGINGDLASSLLRRIDEVIECDPDFITILIGTNDVNSTLSDELCHYYMKSRKLDHPPDIENFEYSLTAIVQTLKQRTRARIALFSLPILGEQLDHFANHRVVKYSALIKKIAEDESVAYLPLNELQREHLRQNSHDNQIALEEGRKHVVMRTMIQRLILFKSHDKIAQLNGLALTSEGIHMNRLGAQYISDLAVDFITAELAKKT